MSKEKYTTIFLGGGEDRDIFGRRDKFKNKIFWRRIIFLLFGSNNILEENLFGVFFGYGGYRWH